MKPFGRSIALIAGLLLLTSLPYIYAFRTSPPEVMYTGLMFDVPDHAQYWSWVTASRNSLFISNTMTPEENPATFTNPMMWTLARVQQAFDLSFPALLQWWRVIAVCLLVPGLLAFLAVMVPERERRPTVLLLALFGSGLGWALIVAKQVMHAPDVPWPQDLYTVEPNTFWALLGYPNILLAQALVLITMLCAWIAYKRPSWWAFGLAATASVVLSLSHAYDLITVYAVLATFGVVEWVRLRRLPVRLIPVGLAVGVLSAPVALYYQRLTTADPLWRSILSQYANAGVWTPPYWHLFVLMGLPLVLAAWTALACRRWTDELRFVAVWAATSLCLIYLPVVYQIKLLTGWQFPLAVLAAYAWHEWCLPVTTRYLRVLPATVALAFVVASTNVYLFAWRFIELRRHTTPYFVRQDSVDALTWIAEHTTSSDVVLAPIEVGQFVPNYGASRSYLAHWAMTNRFFERRDNVDRFFRMDTPDSWRETLLRDEKVTLVFRSEPLVAGAPLYDPARSHSFELMFSRPGAQVYRFRPAERSARADDRTP